MTTPPARRLAWLAATVITLGALLLFALPGGAWAEEPPDGASPPAGSAQPGSHALLPPVPVAVEVEYAHARGRTLLPPPLRVEQVAAGLGFSEGPVWTREGRLLFSDIPANRLYALGSDGALSVALEASGYDAGPPREGFVGSNGLTLDGQGRLLLARHGARSVARQEADGSLVTLADRYEGRRLNSPNDLVLRRADGALYFTDPPYLFYPLLDDHPEHEQTANGVYRLAPGGLRRVAADLHLPNGLAFSPDERTLYVGSSDPERPVVRSYPVLEDGGLGEGADLYPACTDGLKVDLEGNLWLATTEGLLVVSASGERLARVGLPEQPTNLAWGGEDGRTLFVTARSALYRLRAGVAGPRP